MMCAAYRCLANPMRVLVGAFAPSAAGVGCGRALRRLAFGVFTLAISLAMVPSPAWAGQTSYPSPVNALQREGLHIAGRFQAPDGLTGYAATYHRHPVAVYVLPDGQHAIVGTLVDGHGTDLSAAPLARLASDPKHQKAWRRLRRSTWVEDGSSSASRVIYMFTDANCPYCHKFWQVSRPWVKAGKVQIRHIMVGILTPTSTPKAAAILSARNPSAALARDERNFGTGGIKPMHSVPVKVEAQIDANNRLMKSLGFYATPTLVYRDADGRVAVKEGVPKGRTLRKIMGSSAPH